MQGTIPQVRLCNFFHTSSNLILPHTSKEKRDGPCRIITIMYFHGPLTELANHSTRGRRKESSRKLDGSKWMHLNQLLECTVDWGPNLVALVEINSRDCALADAFGSELEFLARVSNQID